MRAKPLFPESLLLLMVGLGVLQGQVTGTPSMPGSVLLLGDYNLVQVVKPGQVLDVRPPKDLKANSGMFEWPSITLGGDLISWPTVVEIRAKYQMRFALGIYSIAERKWKTYGDFWHMGNAAFSPDGSKVAFSAIEEDGGNKKELVVFDVVAEKEVWRKALANEFSPHGWSPDGRRLTGLSWNRQHKRYLIAVFDLNSGRVHEIAEGYAPAWSPTGEWIAYYGPSGQKCMPVRAGTGMKIVKDVGGWILLKGYRSFN